MIVTSSGHHLAYDLAMANRSIIVIWKLHTVDREETEPHYSEIFPFETDPSRLHYVCKRLIRKMQSLLWQLLEVVFLRYLMQDFNGMPNLYSIAT